MSDTFDSRLPASGRRTSAPAIAPTETIDSIRCTARAWQVKSSHGVGFGWSSAVSRRSTGCSTARVASAATIGSMGSGAAAHSSGPASPVVASRRSRSKKCVQPSAWPIACWASRPSCTRVTRLPVSVGSIVTVTVEASGGSAVVALPAPAEDDPSPRLDLAVGAGGHVAGRDGEPVGAARLQVDAGADGLPAAQPLGLGDEGERLVRRDREVRGDRVRRDRVGRGGLRAHQSAAFSWSVVQVWARRCASATSRSSSAVQKDSISRWRRRTPSCSTR